MTVEPGRGHSQPRPVAPPRAAGSRSLASNGSRWVDPSVLRHPRGGSRACCLVPRVPPARRRIAAWPTLQQSLRLPRGAVSAPSGSRHGPSGCWSLGGHPLVGALASRRPRGGMACGSVRCSRCARRCGRVPTVGRVRCVARTWRTPRLLAGLLAPRLVGAGRGWRRSLGLGVYFSPDLLPDGVGRRRQ